MKKIFVLIVMLTSLVQFGNAQDARKLREGTHNLTLQWISWDKPGKAQIKKNSDGTFAISGKQTGKEGDFVTIEGTLTVVKFEEMTFNGTIKTNYSGVNNGEVCEKTGTYHFLVKGARKYWRLQEMDNCEGNNVVDYVDIFF